jgi:hypothetical protein
MAQSHSATIQNAIAEAGAKMRQQVAARMAAQTGKQVVVPKMHGLSQVYGGPVPQIPGGNSMEDDMLNEAMRQHAMGRVFNLDLDEADTLNLRITMPEGTGVLEVRAKTLATIIRDRNRLAAEQAAQSAADGAGAISVGDGLGDVPDTMAQPRSVHPDELIKASKGWDGSGA